ncbi:MAG: DoxX family membrane protein, partial [Paludibacteraceae bacterium]|nr:DoxX family membrane protein [Paludibacteraceae bacterium]
MKNYNYQSLLACILRIILGAVFVFSGFVKAIDPLGTVYKIEDYLTAFGGFFNLFMPIAGIIAGILIALEFALGVMLLLNVFTKWVKWITLLFYICMTILTLYIAIKNPVSDCGCFGDAIVISNWETFWKNVILLISAILLVCCKKYRQQFFVWPMELAILCISVLAIGGFMVYSLQHLPIIDFRPYKIGNNLLELMEYPEDAEP